MAGVQETNPSMADDEKSQQYDHYQGSKPGITLTIGKADNFVQNGNITVIQRHPAAKKERRKRKPKKPVTQSTKKLTIDHRMALKERLGSDWKDLGRYLGFDDAQLDQLEMEYHTNHKEINYQLLLKWEQCQDEMATRACLANIFVVKLKRGDLADILADS